MGLVARVMEWRNPGPLNDYWYNPVAGMTSSGIQVNAENAMGASAVWAAVTIIAGTVGMLPLKLYRRTADGGREEARDDPRFRITHRKPNPWQTSIGWREMQQGHLLLRGNCYSQKVYDRRGLQALIPLHPSRMTVESGSQGLTYIYKRPDSTERVFQQDEILHVRGLSGDGITGYSPVTVHREGIAITMATEQYAGRFFGNGARPGGILTTEQKMGPETRSQVMKAWNDAHQGVQNSHKVAVLEGGLGWQQIGFSAEDAQLIASRSFNVVEAARIFNIPPHKLKELSRATFSNIEQQSLEFLQDTIQPWAERWEQQLDNDLLDEEEQETLFFKFNLSALLRSDVAARGAFYNTLFQMGSMSPNDVRALEEMNPVEGGDQRFVPLNMVPLDKASEAMLMGAAPEPAPVAEEEEPRALPAPETRERAERRSVAMRLRHRSAHAGLFSSVADLTIRREVGAVRKALRDAFGGRDSADFRAWLDTFYESHGAWVAEKFLPVLRAYMEVVAGTAGQDVDTEDLPRDFDVFVRGYADNLGKAWSGSSRGQLQQILRETPAEDVEAAIEARLAEWEEKRAGKVAEREPVEAGEAVASLVYAAAGILALRWATIGENCKLCNTLSGRVVGIREAFVQEGETVDPGDGETEPLTSRTNIKHPPLHRGCNCAIVIG